ncbi:hypothetical protein KJ359_004114 [Pestalotiopsis sp. 9143b]|nr:hypothetical protein KJ359_004114 [Pestalotiopsis sp. 9143b]
MLLLKAMAPIPKASSPTTTRATRHNNNNNNRNMLIIRYAASSFPRPRVRQEVASTHTVKGTITAAATAQRL